MVHLNCPLNWSGHSCRLETRKTNFYLKVTKPNSWSRVSTKVILSLCMRRTVSHRSGRKRIGLIWCFSREGELTWPLIPPPSTHWWSGWPRGLLGWWLLFHFVSLQPNYGLCSPPEEVMIRSIFMVGWSTMGDWLTENTSKLSVFIYWRCRFWFILWDKALCRFTNLNISIFSSNLDV